MVRYSSKTASSPRAPIPKEDFPENDGNAFAESSRKNTDGAIDTKGLWKEIISAFCSGLHLLWQLLCERTILAEDYDTMYKSIRIKVTF